MDDGCSFNLTSIGLTHLANKMANPAVEQGLLDLLAQNAGTIIVLFVLLCFSAFFSSSETAITAVSKMRIKAMADNEVRPAKTALKLINNFDKSITTILVGNNIVNIAMSSISTILALHLGISVTVMTLCITITVILFGEVIPKALAKEFSESYTLKIAGPLRFVQTLLTPFSAVFMFISRLLAKLFTRENEPTVTEDDVIEIIEDMEEEGALDSDESRLLYSAFEFGDVEVIDILTDRRDILSIDALLPKEDILKIVKSSPYSRLPVYKGELDNIIGVLRTREYLESYLQGNSPDIFSLLDSPLFIRPDTKIDELLADMKRMRKPFALVKNRSGRVIGLVTLEDMLEELVGEIWDENDKIEEKFRKIDDNTFEISADLSVVSAFEMIDYEDYDRDDCGHYTLRKWAGRMLGRAPTVGSVFSYNRLDVTIQKVFRGRLVSLIFHINEPVESSEKEDEE